jgi:hypothetical protein
MVSDEIRVTTNIIGFGIEIDFTDSVSVFDFMNDLLQRDMRCSLSNPTECHYLLYFSFSFICFHRHVAGSCQRDVVEVATIMHLCC